MVNIYLAASRLANIHHYSLSPWWIMLINDTVFFLMVNGQYWVHYFNFWLVCFSWSHYFCSLFLNIFIKYCTHIQKSYLKAILQYFHFEFINFIFHATFIQWETQKMCERNLLPWRFSYDFNSASCSHNTTSLRSCNHWKEANKCERKKILNKNY